MLLGIVAGLLSGCSPRPAVRPSGAALVADGRTHVVATVSGEADAVNSHATVENHQVLMQAPVSPGRIRLTLRQGSLTRTLSVDFVPDDLPSALSPGLPDWMVLHTAEDRASFRRWFTAVADRAADLPPGKLPPEISDCSALLRYSFREAMRAHDDKWYADAGSDMPSLQSVTQWTYPDTPMGLGLFRNRPGSFSPTDLHDNTFAQFADAKTLVADNTFFVSRNLAHARPGDLIFYRLLEDGSQYHSMVVTGAHAEWVVYHTGPVNHTKGEMRRVLLADLIHHPDPRWRPIPSNENFLGVYRWNLLAEDR
jgi:uncharacterized protein YfaT (DUF1175 family)